MAQPPLLAVMQGGELPRDPIRSHFRGPRLQHSGFTLVELIVALAIMAMITTVAFAGFRTGLNAWQRGTAAAERLERRRLVERLIRRQLPLAVPRVVFRGSADRIEFLADYSLTSGAGDLRKIDYAVRDGRFFYGETSLFGYVPQEVEELPATATALAELDDIRFEFLGQDDSGNSAWVDEWRRDAEMPGAIRVHLDADVFTVRMVNRQ